MMLRKSEGTQKVESRGMEEPREIMSVSNSRVLGPRRPKESMTKGLNVPTPLPSLRPILSAFSGLFALERRQRVDDHRRCVARSKWANNSDIDKDVLIREGNPHVRTLWISVPAWFFVIEETKRPEDIA